MKSCCVMAGMFGVRCLDCDKPKRSKAPAQKNLAGKSRPTERPYEVWRSRDGSWTWNVLKKWQGDDNKIGARWFCNVVTPICPDGELGDVYVKDIKQSATLISSDY